MQIDPLKIGYLRLASGEVESHITEGNIRQIGEAIEAVATLFELPPDLPALRLEKA